MGCHPPCRYTDCARPSSFLPNSPLPCLLRSGGKGTAVVDLKKKGRHGYLLALPPFLRDSARYSTYPYIRVARSTNNERPPQTTPHDHHQPLPPSPSRRTSRTTCAPCDLPHPPPPFLVPPSGLSNLLLLPAPISVRTRAYAIACTPHRHTPLPSVFPLSCARYATLKSVVISSPQQWVDPSPR